MGYCKANGTYARTEDLTLASSLTFASGQTTGSSAEPGDKGTACLALDAHSVSGTNPTLDAYVMTSHDDESWRYVDAFDQVTGAARAMSSVSSSGTTPPTLTVSGTPTRDIDLKVVCSLAGARGTFTVDISIDGGAHWTSTSVVSAASSIPVYDEKGDSVGVTLGFSNAAAALDNVWTAASGYAMGSVSSSGTTPPTVTISGVANREIDFRMECTTLGARGTAVLRYSIDGGKTWTESVTSAASITVNDKANGDEATGLTLAYANATAAVDNVWTAKMQGFKRKSFSGLDRYVRVTARVGGSSTPTVTASISGEAK